VKLFDYQIDDAQWLAGTPRALLASEMGTGKTATLITAANKLSFRVLVVCPAIARSVWEREWKRWADSVWEIVRVNSAADLNKLTKLSPKKLTVIIASYDLFSRKEKGFPSAIRAALTKYVKDLDTVICDECHYLKSPGSNRTKEVYKLVPSVSRFWVASGTPAPNHYGELWPMISSLWPEALNNMDRLGFEAKFTNARTFMVGGREITTISGSKNGQELKEMLAPYMRRRTKQEVLKDLPSMMWDTLPLDIPDLHQAFEDYASITNDEELLEALSRDKVHLATERRLTGMLKTVPCAEWINELLEPDPGKKIVVFAYHTEVIDRLMELLGNYSPVKVDGRDSDRVRQLAEKSFMEGQSRVFIGQIQAAGTALTLTAASDVLFVESDWVPANNVQAASRCHRIGQTENVIVRHAVMAGSVDEKIGESLVRKEQELAEVFC
jgi:SWI/SNF-related matrix-associated actin-dependent regulator of chromatin subfamily A-like protein 1